MSSKKKSKKSNVVREKKPLLPQASIDIGDNMENEESSFIAESYNSNNTKTEETSFQNNTDLATPEPDQSQHDTKTQAKVSDQIDKEIQNLKSINQKLKKENEALKRQLEAARKHTSRDNEKSEIEPTRVDQLERRIQALEDKLTAKHLPEFNDLNPETNSNVLSNPIKKESVLEARDSDTVKPILSRKLKKKVIHEISIQQANQFLEKEEAIKAYQHFFLHSHLRFPEYPSGENFDVDTSNYGIHVVVKESNSDKTIVEKDFAEDVVSGVIDYKNSLSLPGLNPGKYMMNFYAVVPFMRISEQKNISLIVN